jgi:lysyl-tRNA synthetase class 2
MENLRRRAEVLAFTRSFFAARGVQEVETPVLARGVIVERHIDPLAAEFHGGGMKTDAGRERLFLLTSPESFLKRLIAAGSGPVFQLARVFRDGERGRFHNPEFTLLEWYRPGWDHHALMEEVADLVESVVGVRGREKQSYREVFRRQIDIDPFAASIEDLSNAAKKAGLAAPPSAVSWDRDDWLEFLFGACVQPRLGHEKLLFVHEFPASQAALARVREVDRVQVADRFELFADGVELANGYHELADAALHRERFAAANRLRAADGRPELPVDARFLEALEAGLPSCAGVALGFDRLVMLACGAERIDDVIAFAFDRV